MRGRLGLQIRRYGRYFVILIALAIIGTAAGFFILLNQRLPNPFQTFYALNAAFPTVDAVQPGLGEPVNVAGVRVGQINGTSLQGGQGILHMSIDPSKLPHVYKDARADLVPNTPLKDMQVNITPGTPAAGVMPTGSTISLAQTTSPVDSDELLASLDTDTRSFFTTLVADLGSGTSGRAQDLRALFRALGPTTAQFQQIGDLLAGRRHQIAQVVHNLGVLTRATSQKDAQLRTVVQAGDVTVRALASQDVALGQSIRALPGTLATTRTTLNDVATLSDALGPTATALLPTARRLPSTLRDARTLFESAALLPLKQIPPFVKAVLPLARELPPIQRGLSAALPYLISSFKLLAYTTNELAYNSGNHKNFLYWTAWFAHNSDSFLSTGDAHGPVWRGVVLASCAGLNGSPAGPLFQLVLGSTFGC